MKTPTVTTIIDDLEQQAKAAGLEANRLLAADESLQGLLLSFASFPAHRLVALAETLTGSLLFSPKAQQEQTTTDFFMDQLAAEIARIHRTRLPSALLLIEAIPGRPAATPSLKHKNTCTTSVNQEIISVLQDSAAANALAGQYSTNTFALLLTGLNIGKTLIAAREILDEFRRRPLLKQLICTMGIAVAPSGCALTAESLISLAETQIPQARLAVPDRIHHAIHDSTRLSCQVTAEERAVLFLRPKG